MVDEAEAIAAAILAQAEPGMPADDRASLMRRAEEVREIGRRLVRNLTRAPFRSFAGLPGRRRAGQRVAAAVRRRAARSRRGSPASRPTRAAPRATPRSCCARSACRRCSAPPVWRMRSGRATSSWWTASAGIVVLNPTPETLAAARRAVTTFARERQRFARLRRLPAETLDGEPVELQANLELPLELPLIAQSGAAGIGLLRTEFLFMNRETLPDEDTQTETYRTIVEAMGGDPVTIRVLDWGGEKDIEALSSAGIVPEVADANPALGLRGIRLLLRRDRAVRDAARRHPARRRRRAGAGDAADGDHGRRGARRARDVRAGGAAAAPARRAACPSKLPPLGIMIETPGAALSADALALEADFFAIGTNDLTAVHAGGRSRRDRRRASCTIRCTRRCCGWCSSPPRRRCACACRSRCAARWRPTRG